MSDSKSLKAIESSSILDRVLKFCIENQLIVFVGLLVILGWGFLVAPFDYNIGGIDRDPVAVDAIPDIGENQQIVFTSWKGRSPQDMEDQVTYPLTVALLGIPGVKTVRSSSMLGFSSIYVIFKDEVEFYWSRSRILEKLNSLSPGLLPEGVQPVLGPDSTALGQVYWYTLEGQDDKGNPTGGWDLAELRSIQDYYVKLGLLSAEGVSEVASIGGHVQEYQIDIDPDAMFAFGVSLEEVTAAVRHSNSDVGAKTIEINQVEYVIRGVGLLKTIQDLENSIVKVKDHVPVYLKNISNISLGPASRRGLLDKAGVEAVGGVVVVRYGENPLKVIGNLKKKIEEMSPGLPRKTLADGMSSQVKIVPFYDRTELIHETLGTLESALSEEIIVTILVILILVGHLRSSLLISIVLPISVLMCFIAMKILKIDANIVALSGIAIAIGSMVDMGIVLCENILRHLNRADEKGNLLKVIYEACREVAGAVLTAVSTTVVGFLPVFTLESAEGKLFMSLAYTKSFALIAAILVTLTIIPAAARYFFVKRLTEQARRKKSSILFNGLAIVVLGVFLTQHWQPLGVEKGLIVNFCFVFFLFSSVLGTLYYFQLKYLNILEWCLAYKKTFLGFPLAMIIWAIFIWLGFGSIFSWLPQSVRSNTLIASIEKTFPGLKKEFMPSLDEGSYLYMPTTMPHASVSEVHDVLRKQDIALDKIPEVKSVVGKLGRAETPLDPAPVSMIETMINYYPEYLLDSKGKTKLFRYDPDEIAIYKDKDNVSVQAKDGKPYKVQGKFIRNTLGDLISDSRGVPFRLWRPALDPELNPGRQYWKGIQTPDDIWREITEACEVLGTTSAPKLQPISTRMVMLQSGMRAPMGVKVQGPDLESLEKAGMELEKILKEIPQIDPRTVFAERIVGKPYLEIHLNREEIARYGLSVKKVQDFIQIGIGGKSLSQVIKGRERYSIRVRYMRELRDDIENLENSLVSLKGGLQIPLKQIADIKYVRGPQMIKSEDTFLTSYVLFDKKPEYSEVQVVEAAERYLKEKISKEELILPTKVKYKFSGSYENQVRSENKLKIVLPLALLIIFMILYIQFRSTLLTALVFSGIILAWSGGFILLWFYGQDWFMNFNLFGVDARSLFQIKPINLSVAVWVGFLALFGIASDNGVILGTYLKKAFDSNKHNSVEDIRRAVMEASVKRIRPCLLTIGTTLLALIPVLTSSGKGSDVMVPMAIPTFGGMVMVLLMVLTVPVLYCWIKELKLRPSLSGRNL